MIFLLFVRLQAQFFIGAAWLFRRCGECISQVRQTVYCYGGGQKSNLKRTTDYWLLITDDYLGSIQDGSQQKSYLCQLYQEKSLHFRSLESTFSVQDEIKFTDYWWVMTLPLSSLVQRYQQLKLVRTHRGNHQSSVISKYIWWHEYTWKEGYIYNILYI